jgi:hypothetical protein
MKTKLKRVVKAIAFLVLAVILGVAGLLAYWYLRPNASDTDPTLELEHWVAVADGRHNSNTDLIYWRDAFYLVHANSPWHFASDDCMLIVRRSPDARAWEELAEFQVPGEDVRDPTFAAIGDRLFFYAMKNTTFEAEPYLSVVTSTTDGKNWTELKDVQPEGWLFWRAKSRDGKTWYMPAYWHDHGKSILLSSTDGENWEEVSVIYQGDRNDETAIEFLPDGRMLCTARLEVSDSIFGHKDACTLISVAEPPYTEWRSVKSFETRLDGPCLFPYAERVFAVGRRHPDPPRFLNYFGSILGRKRTSLYEVKEDRLVFLSDLPSAGDTSYAGVVVRDDAAFICYYTSPINRDYPWILGMLGASDIRMARVDLPSLVALADAKG